MNVAQPDPPPDDKEQTGSPTADNPESDASPSASAPEDSSQADGGVKRDGPDRQPDATPTPTVPLHRGERRTAVATAVLALVSAILGGGIAAGSSVWTANLTVRAQQRQSVDEYRRTNRQQIYQDILAQISALNGVMQDLTLQLVATAFGTPPDRPTEILKHLYDRWEPEYAKFTAAISNAELVSSHRIIDVSRALRDAYVNEFFGKLTPALLPPGTPTDARDAFRRAIGAMQPAPDYDPALQGKSTGELTAIFIREAKDDLAFND